MIRQFHHQLLHKPLFKFFGSAGKVLGANIQTPKSSLQVVFLFAFLNKPENQLHSYQRVRF